MISAAAQSGSRGLRLSNGLGRYELAIKQLTSPLVDSSTSFWVRVNSAASGFSGIDMEDIAEARNRASSADVWQLIYDSREQGLWFIPYQGRNGQPIFTGNGSFPLGSWNQVEVRYDAASDGGAQLLINGQTQAGWSVSGDYARSDNLQRIQLWDDAANTTDFDNVVVATSGSSTSGSSTSGSSTSGGSTTGGSLPAAPSNTALPQVTGTAEQGQKIATSQGTWSGSPTSYSYAWEDCNTSGGSCVRISGATAGTYTVAAGDVGGTIRALVTASNSGGSGTTASAQTAVVLAMPIVVAPSNTTLPQVTGTAQQGLTLTASPGTWSGSPTSYSYAWEDCNASGAACSPISAATSTSYTVAAGDVGGTIRALVTASNSGGSTTAVSAPTATVTGSGGGSVSIGTGQSVAFWLAWDSSMTVSQIPWNAVTQVDLFALQTTNGTALDTSSLAINQMNVPQWVATVHQHNRLAMITIGGISDQDWATACDNTNRAGFVSNLINYMVSNGFDGVDLDMEDDTWGAMQPPSAPWDTCVQAISTAAHAARTAAGNVPIVSTDVDQTWMAPYVAGFASYPDQFNLMGYASNCDTTCMAAQVQTMLTEGGVSSPSKMTMGMDDDAGDTGMTVTTAQCGSIANWAAGAGLGGVMVWTTQGNAEANGGQLPCFTQIAPYVAPAP